METNIAQMSAVFEDRINERSMISNLQGMQNSELCEEMIGDV